MVDVRENKCYNCTISNSTVITLSAPKGKEDMDDYIGL